MDTTSRDILKFVGLYRVSTREAISSVTPGAADPERRLKKLLQERLLQSHRGFAGNRSLYQLTKKGAAALGLSEARARRFGGQALMKHLGILLYCQTEGVERYRVEETELKAVLGAEPPDAAHCLCRVRGEVIVLNCYVPGPMTSVTAVSRRIRQSIADASRVPAVGALVKSLTYGFAVLVDSPERKRAVMEAMRSGDGSGPPILKLARIVVEVVPELGTILQTGSPSLGSMRNGAEEFGLSGDE